MHSIKLTIKEEKFGGFIELRLITYSILMMLLIVISPLNHNFTEAKLVNLLG